jgi:serine/threonine protein kinase
MSLSKAEFFRLLKKSRLLSSEQRVEAKRLCQGIPDGSAAQELVRHNLLTPWQSAQLLRGRTRFHLGKYKLLKFRGRGAMGLVFKAQHPQLERMVAVKILSNSLLENPRSVARFLREIRSAAVLNHPNIVVAYDADKIGNTYCLVMEYVSGRSLKALSLEHGRLPVLWSCECARQAALALDHIHSRRLVHRDVKPSNLIVTARAGDNRMQVKLLDVGLARFISEAEEDGSLTRDGQIVGTGDYMAPEQVAHAKDADIRADIYGLGASLFQLITGQAPLAGGSLLQTYMNRLEQHPPPLSTLVPNVSRRLDEVMAKMLARSPDERYQAPVEVAADLAAVLADAATETESPAPDQSAPGSAPNSELRWAPVDGAKIAANPFQPGEFVELGESISEGLYPGPGSSSGAASTTETSADASFHDFLRLVSESPSSHWRELNRRTTPTTPARLRNLTSDASRVVRKLMRRMARQNLAPPPQSPAESPAEPTAESPRKKARKKRPKKRPPTAKPEVESPK